MKNNIRREDISKDLHLKKGFSISLSKKIIDDFIEILILNLKVNSLLLKGVGSFKIIKKNERMGRNPKTGKKHIIKARKSVSFVPSRSLTQCIND